MAKHYVTFGQKHTHSINGKTLDKDTVAVYEAKDSVEGRDKAFEYFGDKFFTDYHNTQFDHNSLKYFPKGVVDLDSSKQIEINKENLGQEFTHICKRCETPITEEEFKNGMGECLTCFPV